MEIIEACRRIARFDFKFKINRAIARVIPGFAVPWCYALVRATLPMTSAALRLIRAGWAGSCRFCFLLPPEAVFPPGPNSRERLVKSPAPSIQLPDLAGKRRLGS